MLKTLKISNIALIDYLELSLGKGLTAITGETGAGKSIILGALRLALGERAELKNLYNPSRKGWVEAEFTNLPSIIFEELEKNGCPIDPILVLRREIYPEGKTRAFLNDTPTTLDVVSRIASQLLDLHSQFDTLQILKDEYHLQLIDRFAHLDEKTSLFNQKFSEYQKIKNQLDEFTSNLQALSKDIDYKKFLLEELLSMDLENLNEEVLENQIQQFEQSESIIQRLKSAYHLLNEDEHGILSQIQLMISEISKYRQLHTKLDQICEQTQLAYDQLEEVRRTIDDLLSSFQFDPIQYQQIKQTYDTLQNLLFKHKVSSVEELISLRETLGTTTQNLDQLHKAIESLKEQKRQLEDELQHISDELAAERRKYAPQLAEKIIKIIQLLGMENAQLVYAFTTNNQWKAHFANDRLEVLFSANAGVNPRPIEKSISGGERSRVMLAIKRIAAELQQLPTLVLDEIDTGVSGKIAAFIGQLMKEMAKRTQLLVITHLPQVAAVGNQHFKVFKIKTENQPMRTQIKLLNADETIEEIASMLSGDTLSPAALENARHLIQNAHS